VSIKMSEEHRQYVSTLEQKLKEICEIAKEARKKGFDPTFEPEPEIAKDLAALVEGLIGPKGVAESIRNYSTRMSREELAFKIAEEIVYGKFVHMNIQEAAQQSIRTALAILTEGITVAPLQGIAQVTIKTNLDRTKYLAIYFAGPIRSAGGTEQALILVVGDFVRRLLGLDRYKPTEEEIGRFIEELRLFERSVGRFQYHVSDEELRKAIQSIPVEVTGMESDPVEVSSFRNLPRIETNRVRGGALRVVNDGVVGRYAKVSTIIEKLGIEGWEWLKNLREIEEKKTAGFMDDVIAGRPIFSFPSKRGGFRLRYGRARNTGLAAVGVHPATMMVLQHFLASGTQLRIQGPGKAGVVLPVDAIEPPVVRLKDGSVIRVSLQDSDRIKNAVDKILFLGDILVSFGDFLYTNKPLLASGYTEEWWKEDLRLSIERGFDGSVEKAASAAMISDVRLKGFLSDPYSNKPTAREAIALALALKIPLHPLFTYPWSAISQNEFRELRRWLISSQIQVANDTVSGITGKAERPVKEILEKLYIPHIVNDGYIKIEGDDAHILSFCLSLDAPERRVTQKPILEIIKDLSGIFLREKAPTFVGARMGRPEKAKRREMKPMVHVLFPVGLVGGSRRNLVEAYRKGTVEIELVRRRCPICQESTFRIKCFTCNTETIVEKSCPRCGKTVKGDSCPTCQTLSRSFVTQSIDFKELIDEACKKLGTSHPELVKGVKGLSNETKTAEVPEKGILRAKYDLSVYKDGTLRFDVTNAPLTHFKANEIGLTVEKLIQLGYLHDHKGNKLTDTNQICELKIQDVIIPRKCAKYFVNAAAFIDELLVKLYGVPPYYGVKHVDDLIGHLAIGLAPHTSVGILGRIIGFTHLNVCYAHSLWHSAKRRDCDGDEDALMLALDTFINFSKSYLPAQIGGIMDAPFFIIPIVNPGEVQRQAHEVDVASAYPLVFYEKSLENVSPQDIKSLVDVVEHRLYTEAQFEGFGYTVPVSDINLGNRESVYKKLKRMIDKLSGQLTLADNIEAVDAQIVARKVLTTHFIRDIAGNLRAFSTQKFRCKTCNKQFRRLPLKGECPQCGGALSLTVYRGGIEKYLEAACQLVQKYGLSKHYAQRLSMIEDEINELFESKRPRQISLADFA